MLAVEGYYINHYDSIEKGYNTNGIKKCSKFRNYYQQKNMNIYNCECGGKYRYTGKHCHLMSNKHKNFMLVL
jgi:hypothetical protein